MISLGHRPPRAESARAQATTATPPAAAQPTRSHSAATAHISSAGWEGREKEREREREREGEREIEERESKREMERGYIYIYTYIYELCKR
jgi:hypothetical protein